jgi:molybdopterin converting factor subunit 1
MLVTVLFLASYREKVGTARAVIALTAGATVAELVAQVCAQYPGLPDAERVVVAVNNEYREPDFVLDDGDEVALIPPVSGGS